MDRYVVALRPSVEVDHITRRLFDRSKDTFANACRYLIEEENGLTDHTILEYPELGVISACLTDEEVAAFRKSDAIQSVRQSRLITQKLNDAPKTAAQFSGNIGPWHPGVVQADLCWETTTGRAVKVGVIDSAIDNTLPNLPIKSGKSFHPDAADWFDNDDSHGTFCAAIIGSRASGSGMIGIAPECELYALRVGKAGKGRSEYIAAAMLWAADQSLDVVSLSQWDSDGTDDPYEPPWEDVGRAADVLTKAGCIIIGIAGNSGLDENHWVTNPGRCTGVMAVGAVEQSLDWWPYSSFGPDDLPESQAVEIVAPGNSIMSMSLGGVIGLGSGTSYAAPQVAGACALVKQLAPHITPSELRTLLKSTSTDLGPPGRDARFGAGLLNCFEAIRGLA